jgi:hypothetical protein
MDALFPKVAKCEWARYGFTGELEIKAIQCLLPMNNLSQWSFFLFWWWTVLVLLINLLSYFHFATMFFLPFLRRSLYRNFVSNVCRDEIETVRRFQRQKPLNRRDVLRIEIGFGDWLILFLLEKNLGGTEFRDMVRRVAVTANPVLQILPIEHQQQRLLNQAEQAGFYPPGAPPSQECETGKPPQGKIGFRDSIVNAGTALPPSYVSIEDEIESAQNAAVCKMGFVFENPANDYNSGNYGNTPSPLPPPPPVLIHQPRRVKLKGQEQERHPGGTGNRNAKRDKTQYPPQQQQQQGRAPKAHPGHGDPRYYEEQRGWE